MGGALAAWRGHCGSPHGKRSARSGLPWGCCHWRGGLCGLLPWRCRCAGDHTPVAGAGNSGPGRGRGSHRGLSFNVGVVDADSSCHFLWKKWGSAPCRGHTAYTGWGGLQRCKWVGAHRGLHSRRFHGSSGCLVDCSEPLWYPVVVGTSGGARGMGGVDLSQFLYPKKQLYGGPAVVWGAK